MVQPHSAASMSVDFWGLCLYTYMQLGKSTFVNEFFIRLLTDFNFLILPSQPEWLQNWCQPGATGNWCDQHHGILCVSLPRHWQLWEVCVCVGVRYDLRYISILLNCIHDCFTWILSLRLSPSYQVCMERCKGTKQGDMKWGEIFFKRNEISFPPRRHEKWQSRKQNIKLGNESLEFNLLSALWTQVMLWWTRWVPSARGAVNSWSQVRGRVGQ